MHLILNIFPEVQLNTLTITQYLMKIFNIYLKFIEYLFEYTQYLYEYIIDVSSL